MLKRFFNISFSIIGLVLLLPIFIIIAIAVMLDSRGSIFFRQERMGCGGKTFRIFKFRTMIPNAEKNGSRITVENDHRITNVGCFLRKYKLDELPQLINVILGQMNFVGPRPELPCYRGYYSGAFEKVLSIRPGITDPASLHFRNEAALIRDRSDSEKFYVQQILPKKLKMNLAYVSNSTLWKDIHIILLTVFVSIFPKSSSRIPILHGGKPVMAIHNWLIDKLSNCLKGKRRLFIKVVIDTCCILGAYFLSYWIRFEGIIPDNELTWYFQSLPLLLVLTLGSFYLFKLYKGLYEYSSIKDLLMLTFAHSTGVALFITLKYFLLLYSTPRSVLIIYWLLGFILLGGVRFSFRALIEIIGIPQGNRTKVLIVGAGEAAEMIIRQMKLDVRLGYHPVCLVDDYPDKRNISIHGVSVLGTSDDILTIAKTKKIDQIIIATPSATAVQMRKIVTLCEKAGINFKTVPHPREIMNGTVKLNQLRSVKIEDLLEREPVLTDGEGIETFLKGKAILVTGAGGSIGQELCWQIMQSKPAKLIMLDHSENSLFYLENDFKRQWADGFITVVGDVCDFAKIKQVMREHHPSIVFHAAAHKHVPLMEMNPEEAIKNNLKGTMVVAQVAKKYDVSHFVLISSDKAVEPINIMGASKRLAELYVQNTNGKGNTKFITVRFGNVLGSNGSVVTLFQKQISRGGPVTVTDPEMTRYFMTISEAVTLILQASAICYGGETFILDMGEPIKVVDMARHLISLSGFEPDQDIHIEFTGIRPGEKMDEQLWHDSENPAKTQVEKIFVANTNGHANGHDIMRELKNILRLAETMKRQAMFRNINKIIPSYDPQKKVIVVDENESIVA